MSHRTSIRFTNILAFVLQVNRFCNTPSPPIVTSCFISSLPPFVYRLPHLHFISTLNFTHSLLCSSSLYVPHFFNSRISESSATSPFSIALCNFNFHQHTTTLEVVSHFITLCSNFNYYYHHRRYRGLKSFRTSPWDSKESLPSAYARIFQLGRFRVAQRRILGEAELAERAWCTLESQSAAASAEGAKKAKTKKAGKAAKTTATAADAAAAGGKLASASSSASSSSSAITAMEEEEGGGDADDGGDYDADADDDLLGGSSSTSTSTAAALAPGGSSSTAAASTRNGAGGAAPLSSVLGPGWVSPGAYVCLTLRNVPYDVLSSSNFIPGVPVVATALLRHENKTSVMNFNIIRYAPYTDPVRSRDLLEFHVGTRVIDVRPVFSLKSSNADKDKCERYLLPERWSTATTYAPICFGPTPVLVYRRVPRSSNSSSGGAEVDAGPQETVVPSSTSGGHRSRTAQLQLGNSASSEQQQQQQRLYPAPGVLNARAAGEGYTLQLVATGVSIGADPDRVIAKRAVLSGFPIKVRICVCSFVRHIAIHVFLCICCVNNGFCFILLLLL